MQNPCLTQPCQCYNHVFMSCLHVGKDMNIGKHGLGPLQPQGHVELWVIFTATQLKARLTQHLWLFGGEKSPQQDLGEGVSWQ